MCGVEDDTAGLVDRALPVSELVSVRCVLCRHLDWLIVQEAVLATLLADH